MSEMLGVLVAELTGTVRCARPASGSLGLELTGRARDSEGGSLTLAFVGAAPADLPATLEGARIEHLASGEYGIASGTRTWMVAAGAVHLHRDVTESFYRVIPPRTAPFLRRLLLGTALRIAGSRAGLAMVRALRR